MTLFTITPFKLADMSALLRLERDIFPEDTFGMIEFISLFLRGKDTFFVARDGRTIVGYIVGYVENDTAYIASIAVDLAYQGQGLGRLLMETVMGTLHSGRRTSHRSTRPGRQRLRYPPLSKPRIYHHRHLARLL